MHGCAGARGDSQALHRSAAAGVKAIEVDVHLTADDVIAVLHDEDVRRVTTDGAGAVGTLTWDQVCARRPVFGPLKAIHARARMCVWLCGSVAVWVWVGENACGLGGASPFSLVCARPHPSVHGPDRARGKHRTRVRPPPLSTTHLPLRGACSGHAAAVPLTLGCLGGTHLARPWLPGRHRQGPSDAPPPTHTPHTVPTAVAGSCL